MIDIEKDPLKDNYPDTCEKVKGEFKKIYVIESQELIFNKGVSFLLSPWWSGAIWTKVSFTYLAKKCIKCEPDW